MTAAVPWQGAGRIVLLKFRSKLTELVAKPYDSEGCLQELLADDPDLLAGEQINPVYPRRWLLV